MLKLPKLGTPINSVTYSNVVNGKYVDVKILFNGVIKHLHMWEDERENSAVNIESYFNTVLPLAQGYSAVEISLDGERDYIFVTVKRRNGTLDKQFSGTYY